LERPKKTKAEGLRPNHPFT